MPGSMIITEPLGPILAIEPWNFPFYQVIRVVAPYLMAGNVVMVKLSPNVPGCALALKRLFEEARAPAGVYTNLFCNIPQIDLLLKDFRIRGVTLTGSTRAGAAVAEGAGRSLKKVVLELGGSDPLILLEDGSFEDALDQGTAGRMSVSGQACVSVKRFIIVGKERGQQFVQALVKKMSAYRAGNPKDPTTTLGPVSSETALHTLLQQICRAEDAGANILLGGGRIDRPGFYLEPTIITNISKSNPLFNEETFGPIAAVYVVDTEDEAIDIANGTQFGLSASIFSADETKAQKLASRIEAGMVFINSIAYTGPEVPFGGIKNSGFGRELSHMGIEEFVNRKLVRVASGARAQ